MMYTRVVVSIFEFLLSIAMLGFGIYLNYRLIIKANPDFDMEDEIKKGNLAVGLLVAAIMLSTGMILQNVLYSVVAIFRMFINSSDGYDWKLPLIGIGHLVMGFVIAIVTISVTLRTFGRLTRRMRDGEELQKGNIAVGVLLASVVIVSAMFVGPGVGSLSKALMPQPSLGKIQILK